MSELKKYHAHVETNDDIEQHEVYLAAEAEEVLKDVKELCLELEADIESAPFHKAASAILERLEETL